MSISKIKEIIKENYSNDQKNYDRLEEQKRALAKDLEECLRLEDNLYDEDLSYRERKEKLESLSDKILDQFYQLYLKPYYSVLGDDLASYRQVNRIVDLHGYDINALGIYDEGINEIRLLKSQSIISKLQSLTHEYEHNLQYEGSQSLLKSGDIKKSSVKEFSDKYPWQLKKQKDYDLLRGHSIETEDIEALYEIIKAVKK